jgi:oligosaccharide repeat unit polymerase
MNLSNPGRRIALLHPVLVLSVVWLTVVGLYSLHLSHLLQYSNQEVIEVTSYILLPFIAAALLLSALHHFTSLAYPADRTKRDIDFGLLEKRLRVWFRIWLLITAFEIVISGGLPIIWLLRHSSKTYTDFGIPSLHGLVNSLLVSVGICRFTLYLLTGKRRHLAIPAFVIFWSMIVVTRQLMLSALLEYMILFITIKTIRRGTAVRIILGTVFVILLFGFIGDLRSGSDAFRMLAEPTAQYPDWLPSGVLWFYIYISTPVNNLMYTMQSFQPVYNLLFPNTAATLFPTVLRGLIYGTQLGQAESGNLVTQAFNVSTAYVGPYQDYGIAGIVLFSAVTGFVCQLFWYRPGLRDRLIFAVLTQCLVLTLFFNLFFALPVISQAVWLFYFFMPDLHLGKSPRSQRQ